MNSIDEISISESIRVKHIDELSVVFGGTFSHIGFVEVIKIRHHRRQIILAKWHIDEDYLYAPFLRKTQNIVQVINLSIIEFWTKRLITKSVTLQIV